MFSLEVGDIVIVRLFTLREMQKVIVKINILKKKKDGEKELPFSPSAFEKTVPLAFTVFKEEW